VNYIVLGIFQTVFTPFVCFTFRPSLMPVNWLHREKSCHRKSVKNWQIVHCSSALFLMTFLWYVFVRLSVVFYCVHPFFFHLCLNHIGSTLQSCLPLRFCGVFPNFDPKLRHSA
jgi:hypothetical protein